MKRPAFQFYPDNWRNNANLRRCSWAARGVWLELMCLMHDSDRYGVLEWPLKEVCRALGCSPKLVKELIEKSVLKGTENGECPDYVYTPKSGRKLGPPVVLVAAQKGPIWYSSRMVKDEYKRIVRGEADGAGSAAPAPSKPAPNPPNGASIVPRASPSPSPTALVLNTQPATAGSSPAKAGEPADLLGDAIPKTPKPPACPHLDVLKVWAEVMPDLAQHIPSQWKGTRADHLRARWRETAVEKGWTTEAEGLAYMRKLFAWCRNSPWLMGKVARREGRAFDFELAWLVNPTNWAKCLEGKYHGQG